MAWKNARLNTLDMLECGKLRKPPCSEGIMSETLSAVQEYVEICVLDELRQWHRSWGCLLPNGLQEEGPPGYIKNSKRSKEVLILSKWSKLAASSSATERHAKASSANTHRMFKNCQKIQGLETSSSFPWGQWKLSPCQFWKCSNPYVIDLVNVDKESMRLEIAIERPWSSVHQGTY